LGATGEACHTQFRFYPLRGRIIRGAPFLTALFSAQPAALFLQLPDSFLIFRFGFSIALAAGIDQIALPPVSR
jgi:hypothetical protein